jgi:O-antigen/teichoic acid export membrane protein
MFGQTLSSILIGIGKPKLSGTLLAVAATQYLTSLFILVPLFGLNGAAISLTLTGVTSLVLIPLFIKRHLKVDVFTGLHKIALASTVSAAILFIVPKTNLLTVILGTAACITVYAILIYFTGYISKDDINIIKTARPET